MLKEPLLHFLVAGTVLFAVHASLNRGDSDDADRVIRITADDVNWVTGIWSRQWQRQPDEAQLRGIVADYVKEQLLAREAVELGLDEDDTIVRRRLAQKMEFMVQDTALLAEPSDDELRALYEANAASYRTPLRLSFTQVFFKTDVAAGDGLRALAHQGAADIGDSTLLERDYAAVDDRHRKPVRRRGSPPRSSRSKPVPGTARSRPGTESISFGSASGRSRSGGRSKTCARRCWKTGGAARKGRRTAAVRRAA